MNNFNSDCLSDFIKCKSIWFLFLTELNWNPSAINPLELVPESFWPEVTDLLIEARYIGQSRKYYLNESDKYMDYLSKMVSFSKLNAVTKLHFGKEFPMKLQYDLDFVMDQEDDDEDKEAENYIRFFLAPKIEDS